jgi:hypothetical protein
MHPYRQYNKKHHQLIHSFTPQNNNYLLNQIQSEHTSYKCTYFKGQPPIINNTNIIK